MQHKGFTIKMFKSAVAFFFLFFLHGFSIGNGQQGISYNVEALAKKGIWNTNVQPLHQSFIVAQKLNLQRQAPFLPMQCYAFALFFSVHFQLITNYFKNKSKIF